MGELAPLNNVPVALEEFKVDDLVVLLAIKFSLPSEEFCYKLGLEGLALSSTNDVVCLKSP